VRYAQKLKNKYSRYDREDLGYDTNFKRAGGGSRGSVHFGDRRSTHSRGSDHQHDTERSRPLRATYLDKPQPMITSDSKYDQIYHELENGLFDRKSIGRSDVFSKGKG